MAKRISPQCKAAKYEDLSGEKSLTLDRIAIETAAPEAVSSHPSSIGAVGSELRVGDDAGAASGVLFGGRARSYPSRQCGAPGCGSNPSKIKSPRMSAV